MKGADDALGRAGTCVGRAVRVARHGAGHLLPGGAAEVSRPRQLDRRTSAVIAGRTLPPSRQHLAYIALEAAKVPLLAALGATLIAAALP
jgi:hypothetical protein